MGRRFIPLKPLPVTDDPDGGGSGSSARPVAILKRRAKVTVACNECRRKKIRVSLQRSLC